MTRVILGLRTFLKLALPYFRSEDRWRACLLLAGVIAAELGLVTIAVATINWNARFFNALEQRSWDMLGPELVIFGLILCGAIAAGMASYYFVQTLTIRWREWTTARYIGLWMAEGRHYRMQFVDQSVDNIHLRIGNDVYIFIQRTLEIGAALLNSVVALVSFSYILWGISATTPLPLFGVDLSVPGYLIWIALAYAAIGTLIAHFIGRPLIAFNFKQQRYEADFRFAMARVTDYSEPVALMKGEAVERQELRWRFGALVQNWVRLVRRHTRLTAFISGYGHLSTAFPILIVTPAYMAGAIPLGILMQAGLAFQRVEGALAFCLSSYSKIAEWKAVVDRLAQFEAAMAAVDHRELPGAALDVAEAADGGLAIHDLILRVANGAPIAAVSELHVAPGERLLINGPSGAGKSMPAPRHRRHLAAGRRRGAAAAGCARDRAAAAALLPARDAAAGDDLSDASAIGRRGRHSRRDDRSGHRPSRRPTRRRGRLEHRAVRRRATAHRLCPCADPSARRGAARRGGLRARGGGGA